jgi:hypothetical protein
VSAPKWAVGMRRIGIGMYIDSSDALHFDPVEVCAALGWPINPVTIRAVQDAAVEVVRKAYGNLPVSHVE